MQSGRGSEERIAVHRGMGRANGAGQTIMRHHGQPVCLCLGQHRVGDDGADRRGRLGGVALDAEGMGTLRQARRPATPAEFRAALMHGCPEMSRLAHRRHADGIDRNEGLD